MTITSDTTIDSLDPDNPVQFQIEGSATLTLNAPIPRSHVWIFDVQDHSDHRAAVQLGPAVGPIVYPTWFGALPAADVGERNDRCFEAAVAASSGRILRVPAGHWYLNSIKILSSGHIIEGAGCESLLVRSSTAPTARGLISLGGDASSVTIRNLGFDGRLETHMSTSPLAPGVESAFQNSDVSVIGCCFRDHYGSAVQSSGGGFDFSFNDIERTTNNAIQFSRSQPDRPLTGLMIVGNRVDQRGIDLALSMKLNWQTGGIELDEGVEDAQVLGNRVWGCREEGIQAENGCRNVQIRHNEVRGQRSEYQAGIIVGGHTTSDERTPAANIEVSDNLVYDGQGRGIATQTIEGSGWQCTESGFVSGIVIRNNRVWNNCGVGIQVYEDVLGVLVEGNEVFDNENEGIASAAWGGELKNNVVARNARHGISLASPDLASRCGTAVPTEPRGQLVITCHVEGNGFGGIDVSAAETVVDDCEVIFNSGAGVIVGKTAVGYRVLRSRVMSNKSFGIVDSTTQPNPGHPALVEDNDLSGNGLGPTNPVPLPDSTGRSGNTPPLP